MLSLGLFAPVGLSLALGGCWCPSFAVAVDAGGDIETIGGVTLTGQVRAAQGAGFAPVGVVGRVAKYPRYVAANVSGGTVGSVLLDAEVVETQHYGNQVLERCACDAPNPIWLSGHGGVGSGCVSGGVISKPVLMLGAGGAVRLTTGVDAGVSVLALGGGGYALAHGGGDMGVGAAVGGSAEAAATGGLMAFESMPVVVATVPLYSGRSYVAAIRLPVGAWRLLRLSHVGLPVVGIVAAECDNAAVAWSGEGVAVRGDKSGSAQLRVSVGDGLRTIKVYFHD